MSASNAVTRHTPEAVRPTIAGDVFVSADAGYDEARRAWNLAVDQRPSVVVLAESAADVVRAVLFARSEGMRIAPRGTGHGAPPLERLEGATRLKMSRLRRVDIYPATRTARAVYRPVL
jgi:FAD/FMN-containing dehydrogenase